MRLLSDSLEELRKFLAGILNPFSLEDWQQTVTMWLQNLDEMTHVYGSKLIWKNWRELVHGLVRQNTLTYNLKISICGLNKQLSDRGHQAENIVCLQRVNRLKHPQSQTIKTQSCMLVWNNKITRSLCWLLSHNVVNLLLKQRPLHSRQLVVNVNQTYDTASLLRDKGYLSLRINKYCLGLCRKSIHGTEENPPDLG